MTDEEVLGSYEGPTLVDILTSADQKPRENIVCKNGFCAHRETDKCPGEAPNGLCENFKLFTNNYTEVEERILAVLGASESVQ